MSRKKVYGRRERAALVFAFLMFWLIGAPMTAHAFVDGDADSNIVIIDETLVEETQEVEETEDTSFSVPGNGEVLDDITDDSSKEFFTVTTKNGNTYYLVIDRSSSTENVYLLSLIDEYDLQDFLEETETEVSQTEAPQTETEVQAAVIIPETEEQTEIETEAPETEGVIEEDNPSTTLMLVMVVIGVLVVGALYFYFKVYRPGQEDDNGESENMETSTEDFSTERDTEDD